MRMYWISKEELLVTREGEPMCKLKLASAWLMRAWWKGREWGPWEDVLILAPDEIMDELFEGSARETFEEEIEEGLLKLNELTDEAIEREGESKDEQ